MPNDSRSTNSLLSRIKTLGHFHLPQHRYVQRIAAFHLSSIRNTSDHWTNHIVSTSRRDCRCLLCSFMHPVHRDDEILTFHERRLRRRECQVLGSWPNIRFSVCDCLINSHLVMGQAAKARSMSNAVLGLGLDDMSFLSAHDMSTCFITLPMPVPSLVWHPHPSLHKYDQYRHDECRHRRYK